MGLEEQQYGPGRLEYESISVARRHVFVPSSAIPVQATQGNPVLPKTLVWGELYVFGRRPDASGTLLPIEPGQ